MIGMFLLIYITLITTVDSNNNDDVINIISHPFSTYLSKVRVHQLLHPPSLMLQKSQRNVKLELFQYHLFLS